MKNKITIIALALAGFAATGCQKVDNSNNAAGKPANNTAVVTQASPLTTPATTSEPAAAGSPTAAYKAAYAARKNKDVEGLKKLLSKDILEFFTEIGKEEKKTLDQMIKELCDKPQAATDDARNEKIDGDHATIEYLDEDGEWRTMDFVKEDGSWKLTIASADGPDSKSTNDKPAKKAGEKEDK